MNSTINRIYQAFEARIISKSDLTFIARTAEPNDVEEIKNCYQTVLINQANICDKLSLTGVNSFYQNGGMFNMLTVSKINNIIKSNTDSIFVLKSTDEDVKINSLLWLCLNTDIYENIEFYDTVAKDKLTKIKKYQQNNEIIYPMDFISLQKENNRGTVYPMLYSIYDRAYKNGYKYAFIEIYTILGYYNKKEQDLRPNKYQEINMENKRSVQLNKIIGAENIGTIGTHTYSIGDYEVITKSEIYGLDLATGINIMKEKIKNQIIGINE